MAASRSEQYPRAGLAVIPEKESEPPQFSPSTILDAGASVRFSAAACSMKRAISRRAASVAPRVPPLPCSVSPASRSTARTARTQVVVDLVILAPQPQDDCRRNVRMHQDAAQRAAQLVHIGPHGVAAAVAVREGHHAIHSRRQRLALVAPRDPFRRVRRTIAGGHHGDVVSRADPPVLAQVAEKGGSVLAGLRERLVHYRKLVIQVELFEGEVVSVNVASGCHPLAGAPDHLAVAPHRLRPPRSSAASLCARQGSPRQRSRGRRPRAVRSRRRPARAPPPRCRKDANG